LRPWCFQPTCGRPVLPGTRGWSWSRSRLAGCHGLNFGWCLLKGAPSLGSSSDDPESSCRPLCLFPFSSSLARFPPRPLEQSPRWSTHGVPLLVPPCRLLCRPQNRIPTVTCILDMLWLANQPSCGRLYPLRDLSPSSLARRTRV
jgi:hypothetical protein